MAEQGIVVERSRWGVRCGTAALCLFGETEPPLEDGLVFRYTLLSERHPNYYIKFYDSGRLVVGIFNAGTAFEFNADDLSEEFPSCDLRHIPDYYYQDVRVRGSLEVLRYKLELDRPDFWLKSFHELEGSFAEPDQKTWVKGATNRGISEFIEFPRIGKFLFINDRKKYPAISEFIDDFYKDNLLFMNYVTDEIVRSERSPLAHLHAEDLHDIVTRVALKPNEIAHLYRFLPVTGMILFLHLLEPSLRQKIIRRSQNVNVRDPRSEDRYRRAESKVIRALRAEKEREEEIQKVHSIRRYNSNLNWVLEDLRRNRVICPDCDNHGQNFRVKLPDSDMKGYVICKECGISIHSPTMYI